MEQCILIILCNLLLTISCTSLSTRALGKETTRCAIKISSEDTLATAESSVVAVRITLFNESERDVAIPHRNVGPIGSSPYLPWKCVIEKGDSNYYFFENLFYTSKWIFSWDYEVVKKGASIIFYYKIDFKKLFKNISDRSKENTDYGTYTVWIRYIDKIQNNSKAIKHELRSNPLSIAYDKE